MDVSVRWYCVDLSRYAGVSPESVRLAVECGSAQKYVLARRADDLGVSVDDFSEYYDQCWHGAPTAAIRCEHVSKGKQCETHLRDTPSDLHEWIALRHSNPRCAKHRRKKP
jgi:hypothetical protein